MRKKLAGVILAMGLGAGGVVAAPSPPPANADVLGLINQINGIFGTLYSLGTGNGGLTLATATQAIIGAVKASEADILNQVDGLFTAQAQACANAAVVEFPDINSYTTDTLQTWANDTTNCVTLIESLWSVIPSSNAKALNTLGMSLGAVGPIALIAREKAGFSTAALKSVLQQGFTSIKGEFTPYCTIEPNDPTAEELMDAGDQDYFYIDTIYSCTTALYYDSDLPNGGGASAGAYAYWQDYNFLGSTDFSNIDTQSVMAQASQDTSGAIAASVLPELPSI